MQEVAEGKGFTTEAQGRKAWNGFRFGVMVIVSAVLRHPRYQASAKL